MRLIVLLLVLANTAFLAWQLLYRPATEVFALPPEPVASRHLVLLQEEADAPPTQLAQAETLTPPPSEEESVAVAIPGQPVRVATPMVSEVVAETEAGTAPELIAATIPPLETGVEPEPEIAVEAETAVEVAEVAVTEEPESSPPTQDDTATETPSAVASSTPPAVATETETVASAEPGVETPPPLEAPRLAPPPANLPLNPPAEAPPPPPFASAALDPVQAQAQAELAQKLSQLSLAGINHSPQPTPVAPLTATAQPGPAAAPSFGFSAAPVAASAPLCLRAGPYQRKAEAEADLGRLRQQQMESALRTEKRLRKDSTWLYLPPFASRDAARQTEADLNRLGVSDHYLVTNPEFNNAVALGLYRDDTSVERRLAELRAKGYHNVQAQPRYQEETVYWLDLRISQDHQQRLLGLTQQMAMGRIACEEIAIRAEIP